MARKKSAKQPRWLKAARQADQAGPEKPDWLGRALARAGAAPLREAEAMVEAGRVKVDGKVVRHPFAPVPKGAQVELDGRPLDVAVSTRVLAFHKPAGVVCSDQDQHGGGGTVFEALQEVLPESLRAYGWHAVGRLDRDTTGLLLFTNDERFVAHATSPTTKLPKRYVAKVGAPVTDAHLSKLASGLVLEDGPTLPAQARRRSEREVELVLTEGRFHQVKRMLGAVGLPVLSLHREAIGGLELDVELKAVRLLADSEVESLLGYRPRHLVPRPPQPSP